MENHITARAPTSRRTEIPREHPSLVEQYISLMAGSGQISEDTVWLSFLPWSGMTPLPPNVIISPAVEPGTLTQAQITALEARLCNVLIVCTFENPDEERMLRNVLPLLNTNTNVNLLMLHFVPSNDRLTRDQCEAIMQRNAVMLASGVDDVLMNPSWEPQELHQAIALAVTALEANCERMDRMFYQVGEQDVTEEELASMIAKRNRLLWESIPHEVMPHFPALDRNLLEWGPVIGNYRLIWRYVTREGVVAKAEDTEQNDVAIKIIDKRHISNPVDLEPIYQEFRFTSGLLRHPNIVSCVEMLHSEKRLYIVFEHAGQQNLQEALMAAESSRLPEDTALSWWMQVASGVAHCHARNVAHRRIALEHVMVNHLRNGQVSIKILDFRDAVPFRNEPFNRACGHMPCMSPEMAMRVAYNPISSDVWSTGVILLEAAGGLGSTMRVSQAEANIGISVRGQLVREFFRGEGSHARALSYINQVQNHLIIQYLQQVLNANPALRVPLRDVLRMASDGLLE